MSRAAVPAPARARDGAARSDLIMEASRMKIVYVVSDRNSRRYYSRIGLAFIEADGSLNVRLDAIPVSGEMQIRDYVPREEASGTPPARSSSSALLGPLT
jgi:hypothetical protein